MPPIPLILALIAAGPPDPPELAPGDPVTIGVSVAERRRARRRYGYGPTIYVGGVVDLVHFKELDAGATTRLHPIDATKDHFRSGTPAVKVVDRTYGKVVAVRQPDGVHNDTIAVRVRVDRGPSLGLEAWFPRRDVVPRGPPAATKAGRAVYSP